MHDLGKAMFGLLKPDQGQVLMNGANKVKSARWSVEHGIAYLSKPRQRGIDDHLRYQR